MEKIAMLGGGAIGLSCAVHCKQRGHTVNLFEMPQFKAPHIDAILKRGGIEVIGMMEVTTKIDLVTTDIEEALNGVNIILICVPAYGIELFGKTCISDSLFIYKAIANRLVEPKRGKGLLCQFSFLHHIFKRR